MAVLFCGLFLSSACQEELADEIPEKEIDELVNPIDVKHQTKFEVETVVISKGMAEGAFSNPSADRSKVNIIVDKSNRAFMEIEKLKPSRIKLAKHETHKDPSHKEVKKIKMIDDMIYTYDDNNSQLSASPSSMKEQMNEMIDMVTKEENGVNFLKPAISPMNEKQIGKIAARKNMKVIDSNDNTVKLGSVESVYNAQSRNSEQMEYKEYYDTQTGLMKGSEVFKDGIVVMRAAYFYDINEEEAELKQIHSVSYYYDAEGNLEEEKIGNTYYSAL